MYFRTNCLFLLFSSFVAVPYNLVITCIYMHIWLLIDYIKPCIRGHFSLLFCISICSEHKGPFVPILLGVCVCVFLHPVQRRAKGPSGSSEGHFFTVPQPDSWAMDSFSCYPTSTVLQKKKKIVCIPPSSHCSPTDRQTLQRSNISLSK